MHTCGRLDNSMSMQTINGMGISLEVVNQQDDLVKVVLRITLCDDVFATIYFGPFLSEGKCHGFGDIHQVQMRRENKTKDKFLYLLSV